MMFKLASLSLLLSLSRAQDSFECVDINDSPTRTFKSLTAYQKNTISFNPLDDDFQGNYVRFQPLKMGELNRSSFQVNGSNYIRELYLDEKSITDIQDGAFGGLECLAVLDLHGNEIVTIVEGSFKGLGRLRMLDLSGNRIGELSANRFVFLGHLQSLNLSHNLLEAIDVNAFGKLTALQHLDLSHNSLATIPPLAFAYFSNLVELNLASNRLYNVPTQELKVLSKLYNLILSNNSLNTFDLDASFDLLAKLYLDNNNISILDVSKLKKNAPHLLFIDLNSNDWNCRELTTVLHDLNVSRILYKGDSFSNSQSVDGVDCSDSNPFPDDCSTTNKDMSSQRYDQMMASNALVLEAVNSLRGWVMLLLVIVCVATVMHFFVKNDCMNSLRRRRGNNFALLDNSNVENVGLLGGRF